MLTSLILAIVCSSLALPASLPVAIKPEEAGFSSERLNRIQTKLTADIERGTLPGAVVLIARNGKIAYFEAFGNQDRAKHIPMKRDSIFRIASMTKPITSVAIMMLAEEGKIDIGAPVSQYLPEFKDVKVGVEKANPDTGKPELSFEAAKRPMTVHDLLRHTSGLTYGIFGNSLVDQAYRSSNMFASKSLADMVNTIAKLPLAHQPGTVWEYSVSSDVLGRIVEVVSGMEFDRFIAERITTPLAMPDTAFYLQGDRASRLARADSAIAVPGDPAQKPPILSGGGGLLSTAGDYARFCQMMLNGGALNGTRLLSPKTVALMTSDQLPPNISRNSPVAIALGATGPSREMGQSFGLGFAVRTEPGSNPLPGSVGDFYWAGIAGTYFWVDPQEKMFAVLMVQLPQGQTVPIWRLTRTLVYQALVR
jgi:CubicO group peptidase (beta-lactamase class C family)